MAQQVPYVGDGPLYRCVLCGAQIPDGASVEATWDTDGQVVTVITSLSDGTDSGTVVHSCG